MFFSAASLSSSRHPDVGRAEGTQGREGLGHCHGPLGRSDFLKETFRGCWKGVASSSLKQICWKKKPFGIKLWDRSDLVSLGLLDILLVLGHIRLRI